MARNRRSITIFELAWMNLVKVDPEAVVSVSSVEISRTDPEEFYGFVPLPHVAYAAVVAERLFPRSRPLS